ncbi:MAG: DNA replication protein [Proteobacteria bacterium]|nr:DNA replication protein [Pseudomonadota bacterium]
MTGTAQLPLDLELRPALGRDDFMVAPSNEVAVAWIDRWPDWPGPALAIYGPPGCGKTHLCQVWRAMSGAVQADAAALDANEPPEILGAARACVLDGAEAVLGAEAERERRVLHLYNLLSERGGHLLVTGRDAPARWACALPDLGSRLAAMTAVRLAAPDDALIEAVLVKLFADRQLRVGGEVVRFLCARMERSFEAARALVAALDRVSLADRRAVTVPLARRVLAEIEQ